MEDKTANGLPAGAGERKDCGCEDGCCPPKKNNPLTRIAAIVILLAALGIIAFKLISGPSAQQTEGACCPGGSEACADSARGTPCDTATSSSCCQK